jgi:hypothetical protein
VVIQCKTAPVYAQRGVGNNPYRKALNARAIQTVVACSLDRFPSFTRYATVYWHPSFRQCSNTTNRRLYTLLPCSRLKNNWLQPIYPYMTAFCYLFSNGRVRIRTATKRIESTFGPFFASLSRRIIILVRLALLFQQPACDYQPVRTLDAVVHHLPY